MDNKVDENVDREFMPMSTLFLLNKVAVNLIRNLSVTMLPFFTRRRSMFED